MKKLKDNTSQILNVPNALSSVRIILIAPMIYYFLNDRYIMAAVMLVLSGISDLFDGYFARKYNQITKLGTMLDPVADKLTLTAVVVCLGIKFTIIMPFIIILLFKELSMLLAGAVMLALHLTPPMAKWYGKLSTTIFYISVIIIVSLKAFWGIENFKLTMILMAITVIFMIFSLVNYFIIFCKELKAYNRSKSKSDLVKKAL